MHFIICAVFVFFAALLSDSASAVQTYPTVDCACTFEFALLSETGQKCLNTNGCQLTQSGMARFGVCEESGACQTSNMTQYRFPVTHGSSMGFEKFDDLFEEALFNEKNSLIWEDAYFEDAKSKEKFYLIPGSYLPDKSFFDGDKYASWKVNFEGMATQNSDGTYNFSRNVCYSKEVEQLLSAEQKTAYVQLPGIGPSGEVVTLVMTCLLKTHLESEPRPDSEKGTYGTDSLGVGRLNKLGGSGSGNIQLSTLIGKIINAALSILGTVALAMFMYGGLIYMTSAGSPEHHKKAWQILIWSSLGVMVILASYALSSLVLNALK